MTFGFQDIGIRIFEFGAKVVLLLIFMNLFFEMKFEIKKLN